MRIYLAASLFTFAERQWNERFAEALQEALEGVEVILPQDFETSSAHGEDKKHAALFRKCVKGIDKADAVVAIADGTDVESGTAWEMGYAYGTGKPVVAVRTDFRPGAEYGVNIMISRGCRLFLDESRNLEELPAMAKDIVRRLKKMV